MNILPLASVSPYLFSLTSDAALDIREQEFNHFRLGYKACSWYLL